MNGVPQHADDFANAFDRAHSRLARHVYAACATGSGWAEGVAAGIRAALAFAAAEPEAAQVLTSQALASGREGFMLYDRMLADFGELLLPGRGLRPDGERLPAITEKAMTSGLAMLVAQRLDLDREDELVSIAPEAIQFVLTPYLGAEGARRVAGIEEDPRGPA